MHATGRRRRGVRCGDECLFDPVLKEMKRVSYAARRRVGRTRIDGLSTGCVPGKALLLDPSRSGELPCLKEWLVEQLLTESQVRLGEGDTADDCDLQGSERPVNHKF